MKTHIGNSQLFPLYRNGTELTVSNVILDGDQIMIPNNRVGQHSIITFENCDFENCSFDPGMRLFQASFKGCTFKSLRIQNFEIVNGQQQAFFLIDCKIERLENNNNVGRFGIERGEINFIELGSANTGIIKDAAINEISGTISNLTLNNLRASKLKLSVNTLTIEGTSNIGEIEVEGHRINVNEASVKKIKGNISELHNNGGRIDFFESRRIQLALANKSKDQIPEFGVFDIKEATALMQIDLADCEIENFIASSSNISLLKLNRCWIKGIFNLENCTIGKDSTFTNVDLNRAQLRFLNASFGEKTKLINVRWHGDYSLYEYAKERKEKPKDTITTLWSLKEIYRQLKVLSSEQHNKIDAMNFQRHEVKTYYKIIEKKFWSRSDFSWPTFSDWLILALNNLFSNFGLSWFRPLISWVVIHGLLFIILLSNFDLGLEPSLLSRSLSWSATCEGAKMFLETMFPIHSKELVNVITFKRVPIWGFTDCAMRVIAPFFIYYFIRGTRKFNV